MELDIYEDVDNTILPSNDSSHSPKTNSIYKFDREQLKSPKIPNYSCRPIRFQNNVIVMSGVNNDEQHAPQDTCSTNAMLDNNNSASNSTCVVLPIALNMSAIRGKKFKKFASLAAVVIVTAAVFAVGIAASIAISPRQSFSTVVKATTAAVLDPTVPSTSTYACYSNLDIALYKLRANRSICFHIFCRMKRGLYGK